MSGDGGKRRKLRQKESNILPNGLARKLLERLRSRRDSVSLNLS